MIVTINPVKVRNFGIIIPIAYIKTAFGYYGEGMSKYTAGAF